MHNNTGRNTCSYSLGEEWDRLKVVGDWGRYGVGTEMDPACGRSKLSFVCRG